MHRQGRHWPTMREPVSPLVDTRKVLDEPGASWSHCIVEWVAIFLLVALTVVAPIAVKGPF